MKTRRVVMALALCVGVTGVATMDRAFGVAIDAAHAAHPACCPAPRIYGYPALYAFSLGRWHRAVALEQGARVRFALLFRWDRPGWLFPSASLQVRKMARSGVSYGPAIYDLAMKRERQPHGYTHFSVTFQFQKKVTGRLVAYFYVTNGTGAAGLSLPFTVQPKHR